MRQGTLALFAVAVALAGGGCGSAPVEDERDAQRRFGLGPPPVAVEGGGELVAAPAQPSAPAAVASCDRSERLGDHRVAYAARARERVTAFRRPAGARIHTFERRNANGVRTVFGVLAVRHDDDCRPAWYRVQLPLRPNGATGWVRARDVALFRVRTRIEIDLGARRIDFFRDGRRVLRVATAIGRPGTPTPTGRYYVNQRLLSGNPGGPFGPGAIGISAFSPVLTGWTQGGPIAIHGTNNPASIGTAASYGCLRIENRQIERMLRANPEGTPVLIRG